MQIKAKPLMRLANDLRTPENFVVGFQSQNVAASIIISAIPVLI